MPVFAVKGANWDHARDICQQPFWDQHAAFVDQLTDSGEETLRSMFDAGPWTVHKVFRVKDVRSWTLWLDGRSRDRQAE
jgi:hypothetical protein